MNTIKLKYFFQSETLMNTEFLKKSLKKYVFFLVS
jgi:hypothetical protein